ncbi:hypothetical protein [Bradyrhizobium sp. 76]|uniref:hypothetical protein n=1 Tax=Bradyrhizobium sp. 76 TaxID=2782680 RepID=UPI001FF98DB2|nr:hypothetical protein [Bradyrhizobium sp. 76]MCK1404903.1 hypothetical protein [Bradyrhizobium sp. 76]
MDTAQAMIYMLGQRVVRSAGGSLLGSIAPLVNLPDLSGVIRDIDNLGRFHSAMNKIAKLNAIAASCAFLSALLQAITMVLVNGVRRRVDEDDKALCNRLGGSGAIDELASTE